MGGSFEFAWKIVSASPTYDMFPILFLFSLLAGLLNEISGIPRGLKAICTSRLSFQPQVDWRPAMSLQLANWRADCLFATVYEGGAPPGLRVGLSDLMLRHLQQSLRLCSAARV
jgi:hypothetical protein